MENNAYNKLKSFKDEHNAVTKGPLALLVQLARIVRTKPFPLDAGDFLTENKGQVAGLGGGNLKRYSKATILRKCLLQRAAGQAVATWA
jgi:hypothetical protein